MATKKEQKDLLARLTDAGEDAIQQLSKSSAGKAIVEAANTTRMRIDELTKRVRGVESLEARVSALEKQLAARKKKSGARKPAAKKPAARKTPAA